MKSYDYQKSVPAIRGAGRGNPARCPWCGEDTWIVSDADHKEDRARVEMYCDNQMCDSRETVLLITRGFDDEYGETGHGETARTRGDVEAIRAVDDLGTTGKFRESARYEENGHVLYSLAEWYDEFEARGGRAEVLARRMGKSAQRRTS